MASKMYGQMISKSLSKEINYLSDTIKVALVSSAYTPNQDTHVYWSDVVANEITGTGYTAGGQALGTKTQTYNAATNVTALGAANSVWSNSTITARYAVIYDDSGATNAAKALLSYVDFGAEQSSTNGNFTVTWDSSGIIQITVA